MDGGGGGGGVEVAERVQARLLLLLRLQRVAGLKVWVLHVRNPAGPGGEVTGQAVRVKPGPGTGSGSRSGSGQRSGSEAGPGSGSGQISGSGPGPRILEIPTVQMLDWTKIFFPRQLSHDVP